MRRPKRSQAEAREARSSSRAAEVCASCPWRPCLPGDAVTDLRGRSSGLASRPGGPRGGSGTRPSPVGRGREGGGWAGAAGGSARPVPGAAARLLPLRPAGGALLAPARPGLYPPSARRRPGSQMRPEGQMRALAVTARSGRELYNLRSQSGGTWRREEVRGPPPAPSALAAGRSPSLLRSGSTAGSLPWRISVRLRPWWAFPSGNLAVF